MLYRSKIAPQIVPTRQRKIVPTFPRGNAAWDAPASRYNFCHWLGNWLLLASLAFCGVPSAANAAFATPTVASPKAAAAGSWSFTGVMSTARELHTFTKLNDGRVLVVGGSDGTAPLASVEIYNPNSNLIWSSVGTGSLVTARSEHTATLLPNGKVLVTGGANNGPLASAEIYTPTTGTWAATGAMATARTGHTAILLSNGKVLVAGGTGGMSLATAELYDPSSGTWTATGSMITAREAHTATVLANGKVLVAGGYNYLLGTYHATAELYDPSTGTWTATGAMTADRKAHTATKLVNGKVLVVGGVDLVNGSLDSAEVYDPAAGVWTAADALLTKRNVHTATLLSSGKVLVVGGYNDAVGAVATAELYDPAADTWSDAGSLAIARRWHTAYALPNGKVLVAGGLGNGGAHLHGVELFDPSAGTWISSNTVRRSGATATRLTDGRVLVLGGMNSSIIQYGGGNWLNNSEIYDPNTGIWSSIPAMSISRRFHTATVLTNGKVLVAGGKVIDDCAVPYNYCSTTSVALYDLVTNTWSNSNSLSTRRSEHTATLLTNGKVFITGGYSANGWGGGNYPLSSSEIYDTSTGTWTSTGSMTTTRINHTATKLANGMILVAGGLNNWGGTSIATAELYDSTTGLWRTTGSMSVARHAHAAVLLASGYQVLVTGGYDGTNTSNYDSTSHLNSSELYDLSTGTWTTVGETTTAGGGGVPRNAILLPNGSVLITGGYVDGEYVAGAEIYDPSTKTWTAVAPMSAARQDHTTTLLTNGQVLVTGGYDGSKYLASAELYNPGPTTDVPTATTAAATSITTTSATLNGTVTPNGAATTVTFNFGTTTAYGTNITATPASITATAAATNVSATKTGLTCNTLYHYRITAVNSIGSSNGADQTFTTATCPVNLPIATTNAATNIAATSAKLNGSVSSDGNTATASFDFGTTTNYGQTIAAVPSQIYSKTAVTISATASSLTCNSPYHFRATAISSAGTGTGADQTFTTLPCAANSWLTPPTSIVTRDQPFTLDIIVKSDGMKVSSYEFAVTLDPTKLQFDTTYQNAAATCYLGVCPGNNALINRNMVDTNIAAGTIVLTGQDATGQGPGNDLQLVVIHFKTKTAVGAMPVTLVANKLQNPSGGNIGLITTGATVNVSYGLCGDSDGNRMVNIVDALAIARKLVGLPPPPTIDDLLADTNKNSRVDINDALFIARYAIGLVLPPEACNIGQPL